MVILPKLMTYSNIFEKKFLDFFFQREKLKNSQVCHGLLLLRKTFHMMPSYLFLNPKLTTMKLHFFPHTHFYLSATRLKIHNKL